MNAENVTQLIGDLRLGERPPKGTPYIYASVDGEPWIHMNHLVELGDRFRHPRIPYNHVSQLPSTRTLVDELYMSGAKEVFIVVAYATAQPYSPTLNFEAFIDALYTNTINGDEHDPEEMANTFGPWWWCVDTVYAHRVSGSSLTQHKTHGGLRCVLDSLSELEEMFEDSTNQHAAGLIAVLADHIRAH